jgi:protein-disulfide isomerase-like protein with CxxC motif
MSVFKQYYLAIIPVSDDSAKVESYINFLSETTGLDSITVKQKFVGTTAQILRVHNDFNFLENIAQNLNKKGFPSVVIDKNELMDIRIPSRAKSVEIEEKEIRFLDHGKT